MLILRPYAVYGVMISSLTFSCGRKQAGETPPEAPPEPAVVRVKQIEAASEASSKVPPSQDFATLRQKLATLDFGPEYHDTLN